MGSQKRTITVEVTSEHETLFYGECTAVTVPTETDTFTILPHHTPIIAKLGKGEILVYDGRAKQLQTIIDSGLLYVGDDEVVVLVNL